MRPNGAPIRRAKYAPIALPKAPVGITTVSPAAAIASENCNDAQMKYDDWAMIRPILIELTEKM